jgi:hypothetical protein
MGYATHNCRQSGRINSHTNPKMLLVHQTPVSYNHSSMILLKSRFVFEWRFGKIVWIKDENPAPSNSMLCSDLDTILYWYLFFSPPANGTAFFGFARGYY